jgi:hypothetical protein
MGNLGYIDSAAPTQIVDENNERYLLINSDGSIPAQIKDSAGASITVGQKTMSAALPVVIASDQSATPNTLVDGTVTTQKAKVDTYGRLWVYMPPAQNNVTINFNYNNATSTPINTNEWQDVIAYTVPANYDLSIIQLLSLSSQGGDQTRVAGKFAFGSYNTATNTFTDGSAQTAPAFSSELYCYVTTLIGGVGDDVITITYTNESGVTGHTATATVKKNSLVGTRVQTTLQAGDLGVTDVTAVTHTRTGQAGAFNIEGATNLVLQIEQTANAPYTNEYSVNSLVVNSGQSVYVQYQSNAPGAKVRQILVTGTLVPRA